MSRTPIKFFPLDEDEIEYGEDIDEACERKIREDQEALARWNTWASQEVGA